MLIRWKILVLTVGSLSMVGHAARAQDALGPSSLDVKTLFATTGGFCHTAAGSVAGKGPPLMNTKRSDDFIRDRIKNGKEGAMPAFGSVFSDADIDAIIKYIRDLKPEQG